ncbi:HupE/UreJ family protein [Desertibaculum subflavum]|uniref:HupE/UreJ family protein n=1 Tax=Desertibaculum subflavum TaxID=2268458 RepID=UPI000E66009E
MTLPRIRSGIALSAMAVLAAAPAWAHHPMGGATPATLAQGLLSGLAHPVIGLDHLAFVVAAGVLAAPLAGRFLLPAAFVVAGLAAALWHVAGFDLPAAEIGVPLSVLVLGGIVLWGRALPAQLLAALFALAGLLHGYALAETVVGAETTPVVAYLAGFGLVQYLIALGAMAATRALAAKPAALARAAVGAAAVVVGLVQLGLGFA